MKAKITRPIVGLFMDREIVNNLEFILYYRVNKLAEAAKRAGVTLAVFSIGDISFRPERLRGICFDHLLQHWKAINLRIPDILYDRFTGGSALEKRQADYIRYQLTKRGVKKINAQSFFDKYEVHQILSHHGDISPHLPFTAPLQNIQELKPMFRRFDKLYIKASTGRRGKQVISVTRLPEGGFAYSYFNNQLFSGKVNSLSGLAGIIDLVIGNRNMIVQQAVDLIKIKHRIVDMRGELQRNGQGELEIVAVLVRVGDERSPVATHGSSFMFEEFISRLKIADDRKIALYSKISIFLETVYSCMEQAYGPFGEIAVDFGIDRSGKLWFFECNAKSMKVSLCKAADSKTVTKAFLNPMLYAKYLFYQDDPQA